MMEFFEKIFNWLASLFGNDNGTDISGKNSTNINGDNNIINSGEININITNNYVGGWVKFDNYDKFLIIASTEEEISNRKYRVLYLGEGKTGDCILFIEGEIPVAENFRLKARSIQSRDEIKTGNYYLMKKQDETPIPE
ncbi:MAG: hypothetical protein VZR56_07220 [Treponema sp.]|nr:hypothetical protein [Treponema sp.]